MPLWLTLALFVGFTVLGQLLRPRQKFDKPQPSGLGDFTLPTAIEGRAIPVVWGRCKVSGPNCVWYGDLEVQEISEKVKTGLFSSKRVTTGYRYFLGEQLALCHGPIDSLLDVQFDGKSVFGGQITVVAGKNSLRHGFAGDVTSSIPPGTYNSNLDVALAMEDAMYASDGGIWKVVYGYHLVPGRSSLFEYSVDFDPDPPGAGGGPETATTLAVDIGGVWTRGRDVAFALQAAMNSKEREQSGGARVRFRVAYSERTHKFRIGWTALRSTVLGVYVRGVTTYAESALPALGFQMGGDQFQGGSIGHIESDYETYYNRFMFAFTGFGGHLYWNHADTTCEELFGPGFVADDVVIGHFACLKDRENGPNFAVTTTLADDRIRVAINAPELFGGDKREGGISGAIDVYRGSLTQTADDYLEEVLGILLPGYRGLCYAVFRHLYVGTTAYPKNPSFIIQRCPNQLALGSSHHIIDGDANPACMLYEVMTDTRWGLAIPTASIDTANFQAVGDVLFDEGFGLSLIVDSQTDGNEILRDILRHIDGVIFTDPTTGKLKIVLARNDYDPGDLITLDDDNSTVTKLSRPAWEETTNSVKVKYTSRADNFTERVTSLQDLANRQARGGGVSHAEYSFSGITKASLAQLVTARVLRAVSYPLAPVEIDAHRIGVRLQPGSVFKGNWADYPELADHVFRVTGLGQGEPRNGKVSIQATEDIYGITWSGITPPGDSEWEDPAGQPRLLLAERLEEAPYPQAGGANKKMLTMGAHGSARADGYEVWTDETGSTDYVETADVTSFTAFGRLSADTAIGETSITVDPVVDTERVGSVSATAFAAGANLAIIDDEWVAFETVVENEDGSITLSPVARGVIDTAPRAHSAGAEVFFFTTGSGFSKTGTYSADGEVGVKLLPYNPQGTASLDQAEAHIVTLASRALRPYCPTAFEINGAVYPATLFGDIALAWEHRDRGGSWDYDDSGITATPETACSYRLRIYNEAGTLLRTVTQTGKTYSYTNTTERSDNGGNLAASLRFVLDMKQDGGSLLESWQAIDWTVERSDSSETGVNPWGTNYCGTWGA